MRTETRRERDQRRDELPRWSTRRKAKTNLLDSVGHHSSSAIISSDNVLRELVGLRIEEKDEEDEVSENPNSSRGKQATRRESSKIAAEVVCKRWYLDSRCFGP